MTATDASNTTDKRCSHGGTVAMTSPQNRQIQRPIKMGFIELSGGVHTTKRQTSTLIPTGFCVNLLVSLSRSLFLSQCQAA